MHPIPPTRSAPRSVAAGGIHVGANVENAAYPQGQCAEATAIGAMIAAGETRIAEVAVIGTGDALCTPCGGCRQRLREFAAEEVKIHLCGAKGIRKTVTLGDLLPLSFGPAHLGAKAAVKPAADAAQVIRTRAPKLKPRAVLILGSGLGPVADAIEGAVSIPYKDLPGFPSRRSRAMPAAWCWASSAASPSRRCRDASISTRAAPPMRWPARSVSSADSAPRR